MNTRFDGQLWIGAFGVTLEVKEMETGHLCGAPGMDRQPQGGHPQGVRPQHHKPLR